MPFPFNLSGMWKEDSNVKAVLRAFEERHQEYSHSYEARYSFWNSSKNIVVSPWAKLVYLRSLSPLKNALKVSIQLPRSGFVWQSVLPC